MVKKQFIIIGLGRFGESVAITLSELGYDVLAVDIDETRVHKIKEFVTDAVVLESTNEDALKTLGVGNFDVGVVAIGKDIQANILTALILKELGVPQVVARAQNDMHGKLLSKIGADKIVYPERDMGTRIAYNIASLNVLDYIELSPDFSIEEVVVNSNMGGNTLKELDLRTRFNVNVLAIKRGEKVNVSLNADEILETEDILVVLGPNDGLLKMKRAY